MKLNKVLGVSCAMLAALLGVQMLWLSQRPLRTHVHASWKYEPKSIAAARKDAEQIVQGRVVKIERARDICVAAKGEPGGKDCIPNEVVTIALEGAYKGATPQLVRVFHTGISPTRESRKIPPRPKDNKHGGQAIKNSRKQNPSAQARNSYSLEDDPPYKMGARYALFLGKGPRAATRQGAVATMTPLHPSVRMEIRGDTLNPASTQTNLGKQLKGKRVTELTKRLPKLKALPFKSQAPALQKMKLNELKRSRNLKEYNRLIQELPAQQQRRLK